MQQVACAARIRVLFGGYLPSPPQACEMRIVVRQRHSMTPPPAPQAIRERTDSIKACKMRIFVRRGGPNYKTGLDMMRRLGDELGIPIEVHQTIVFHWFFACLFHCLPVCCLPAHLPACAQL